MLGVLHMLLIDSDREKLYECAKQYFDDQNIVPKVCELGVLNGDNALNLIEIFKPKICYLIDSYSRKSQFEYKQLSKLHKFMNSLDEYSEYYGGSLNRQSTFNSIFKTAKNKLKNTDAMFIRENTRDAISEIEYELDFIYIDANHNYEHVLEDLVTYSKILSKEGIIQLNDVVMHESAHKQNIGVIDALNRFLKISDFQIVVIILRDWSDALITRTRNINRLQEIFLRKYMLKIEVPNSIFGSYKIIKSVTGTTTYSFGC
jgi:hypothetical protein